MRRVWSVLACVLALGPAVARAVPVEIRKFTDIDFLPTASTGGSVAEVGDQNGDGVPDVAVSGGVDENVDDIRPTRLALFSGADGTRLAAYTNNDATLDVGVDIVLLPDLTDDGRPEFAASITSGILPLNNQRRVEIFRFDGAAIHVHETLTDGPAQTSGSGFGASLSAPGDLDGDGEPDLVIGGDYGFDGGRAVVFSTSGESLLQLPGPMLGDRYGEAVSDATPPGATGTFGFFLGSEGYDLPMLDYAGRVILYEPDPMNPGPMLILREVNTIVGDQADGGYGATNAGIGDLDGDGVSEVLVSNEPFFPAGRRVRVHNGATGDILYNYSAFGTFGQSLAGLGDVDGDRVPDFAVGSDNASGVRVYSGASGALIGFLPGGYDIGGAADIDGDGLRDVLTAGYGGEAWATSLAPDASDRAAQMQAVVDGESFADAGDLVWGLRLQAGLVDF